MVSLFSLAHIYLYNDHPDFRSYFSLFYTNFMETMEFVRGRFRFIKVLLVIFLILFIHVLLFKLVNNIGRFPSKIVGVTALILICLLNLYSHLSYRLTWFEYKKYSLLGEIDIIYSFFQEKKILDSYKKVINKKIMPNIWRTKDFLEESVHVLVIGESLGRHHMSLYGYPRETTPNMKN